MAQSLQPTVYRWVTLRAPTSKLMPLQRPALDPQHAREELHILFFAYEHKKPWAIYQIPGLLPTVLANLAFHTRAETSPGRHSLPAFAPRLDFRWARIRPCGPGTIVTVPLEMIVTRLRLGFAGQLRRLAVTMPFAN
ncbi:hypothetical protein B0H17DRAFT_1192049 [Mycena rosella]|uniref:Uncharacterized protein n=1 Tax=Mycena rosella TaxID=1033263 RepID=A0AAD7GXN2_MYCRO|nr:hypothetical protein B0H17DRAFT_1192049 [Mycena rosella]